MRVLQQLLGHICKSVVMFGKTAGASPHIGYSHCVYAINKNKLVISEV